MLSFVNCSSSPATVVAYIMLSVVNSSSSPATDVA